MFKSSENLRLAAEMRALERVARPWRQARTSWFDGTPESLEARIAQTDRVLAHARSGFTTAHLTLAREASAARAELVEAKHRLLTDFLDDGARAFKGSRRVAEKERGLRECINCGGALSGEQDDDKDAECLTCGMSAHQKGVDWRRKGGSRRTAGSQTDLGGGASVWDIGPTETMYGTESLSLPGAVAKGIANGAFMTGQEDTPAFNPGPKVASLDEPCGDCGAGPGEPCDEDCINHEDYDKRHQVPPELAWMADAVRNYPGPNPYHNHSHGPEHHRPYDDDPDSRYAARTRTTRRSR